MTESRLHVERSGGFGGLVVRASVAMGDLSSEERRAVEECFRPRPSGPSGPDRFVYRLRLGRREAVVQEGHLPSGLEPLLERLDDAWTC